MFSAFGKGIRKEISSMPGIYQQSIENIVEEAQEAYELGVPAVILFGIPETKDAWGVMPMQSMASSRRRSAP